MVLLLQRDYKYWLCSCSSCFYQASVKEKSEIKNMKTIQLNNTLQALPRKLFIEIITKPPSFLWHQKNIYLFLVHFIQNKKKLNFFSLKTLRDVCNSLVAHLAAGAATRVQIPASCQILYKQFKTRDGVYGTLVTKRVFKKPCNL